MTVQTASSDPSGAATWDGALRISALDVAAALGQPPPTPAQQRVIEAPPSPALVVFLRTPTGVLKRRLKDRARANPDAPVLEDEYVRELNEAYNHFFFHYTTTPLLVVETSQFDLTWGPGDNEALEDLVKQLNGMGRGTRYYVPRTR